MSQRVLTISELPPEMPSCSMVAIENNNALQFSCAWPGGFPNARIRWVGLSRNVSADSQLVQDEASPARLDGKNVTCVARHEVETKSCSIAPVSPIVVPSRLVAAETQGGATVTLRCRVTSNPSPVVRWYKEQRRLTSGSKFVIAASGTEMTIRNFTLGSDVGNYSCSCSNPLGVSARTLALTVPVISDMVVTRLNATTVVVSWAVRDSDIVTSFLVQLRAGAQRSLAKSSSSSSSSSSSDWRTERVAAMDDRSATVSRLWEEQGYSFRVVPVTGLAEGPPSEAQSVAPTVDRRLSIGAIAGIVVGCVAGALLMLLLVGCLLKRQYEKKKEAREKKQSPNGERVNQRNDQYANFQRAPYGMETGMPPRLDRPESSLHRSVSNKTDLPHSSPAQPPIKSSTLARQKRLATMV
ncbi:V-set and immunoglobulin domain-containing protein 10-like isoform X2 [Heptranchias perlo]|uniref:V-set and immunoglobulin domain-containing protein 10-like isoform X2 n=1 Tax=Heptranchias perlo TaxID=212740 RepID=UPI00355A1853